MKKTRSRKSRDTVPLRVFQLNNFQQTVTFDFPRTIVHIEKDVFNPFLFISGLSCPHYVQASFYLNWLCAAKAIFYCPTMNSHRPRSQNTSKEQALIPEKESRRTWPRCHVSLEKSSKNHEPLEKWAKPNLFPDVTPQLANFYGEYFRRICHVVSPDPPELFAVFSRHSGWPK